MCNHWSLGMEKQFGPILYNGYDYLSMQGLRLILVGKRGLKLSPYRCCILRKSPIVVIELIHISSYFSQILLWKSSGRWYDAKTILIQSAMRWDFLSRRTYKWHCGWLSALFFIISPFFLKRGPMTVVFLPWICLWHSCWVIMAEWYHGPCRHVTFRLVGCNSVHTHPIIDRFRLLIVDNASTHCKKSMCIWQRVPRCVNINSMYNYWVVFEPNVQSKELMSNYMARTAKWW